MFFPNSNDTPPKNNDGTHKKTYYDALGVSKEATPNEIKKAYRMKAKMFHPDKNQNDINSEETFKDLLEAYNVLKDPQKRTLYDQYDKRTFDPNFNIQECMESFKMLFGGPAFYEVIGDMSFAKMFSCCMSEEYLLETDEKKKQEAMQKYLLSEQEKRKEFLIHKMLILLEPYTSGANWIPVIQESLQEKINIPGGAALLEHIGSIYESESKRKTGRFFGLEKIFTDLKFKGSYLYKMRNFIKLYYDLSRLQDTLKNDKNKDKDQLEEEMRRLCFILIWKYGLLDIEGTLRSVCRFVLKDPSVPPSLRKKRADGLGAIAHMYIEASRKALSQQGEQQKQFGTTVEFAFMYAKQK